jgi:hypothetical protein
VGVSHISRQKDEGSLFKAGEKEKFEINIVKMSILTIFVATKAQKHLQMPKAAIEGCFKRVYVFFHTF